jgi:putative heme transporter
MWETPPPATVAAMALPIALIPPTALTAPVRPVTAWEQRPRRAPGGRGGGRAAKLAASGVLAVLILAVALPRVAGAEWGDIARALGGLTLAQLAVLTAVWLAGLWAQTPALTAAMPGLSHRRALLLNLTGSFVSNLLPLGGAAGTVANWRMARSWGFDSPAFARWALLTNLVDTLLKFVLPGLALCWLALAGVEVSGNVGTAAWLGLGLLTASVLVVWLVARDDRAVRWLGARADWLAGRVRFVPRAEEGYAARAATFRRDSAGLVSSGWGRMLVGKLAYALLQAVLLWLCLQAIGAEVQPAVVAAAFAVERILTMAAITPGATGIVELGMAGVFVAFGVEPATAAAGVLLYRAFIFGLEIPVGGLSMLAWSLRRRVPLAA